MPFINQIKVDGIIYDIEGVVGKKYVSEEGELQGDIFGDYDKNIASGDYSHAEGVGTVASNTAEHAEGKYNKSNENTIHSVGVGTSDSDRRNAFEISSDGSVYINGIGGYDGTTTTGVKPISDIIDNIESGENITASKLGKDIVGSNTKPIYLNDGTPVASNASIGNQTSPIYMESGEFKQCNETISEVLGVLKNDGDGTMYLADDGTYKSVSATGTVEVANKLGTSNVGSNTKPIYLTEGSPTEMSQTIGASDKPVYINGGTITQCSNTLGVNISGNANTADYINRDRGSNIVSTLANLPITKSTLYANLSGPTSISLNANLNVGESITVICIPSVDFTQPIPNSGSFTSMDGDSLSIKNGKLFEINIYCYTTNKYSISSKIQK